jgi:hypothetical protein
VVCAADKNAFMELFCAEGNCGVKGLYAGLGLSGVNHIQNFTTNIYRDSIALGSSKSSHGSFGIGLNTHIGYHYRVSNFAFNIEIYYQPTIYKNNPYNLSTHLGGSFPKEENSAENTYYFSIDSDIGSQSQYGIAIIPGVRIASNFYFHIIVGLSRSSFSEYNLLRRNTPDIMKSGKLPARITMDFDNMDSSDDIAYVPDRAIQQNADATQEASKYQIQQSPIEYAVGKWGFSYGTGIYFYTNTNLRIAVEAIMTDFGAYNVDKKADGLERQYAENKIFSMIMKLSYHPFYDK